MRLRIGIGMARMSTLCHKSLLLTSYIIYGNALGVMNNFPSCFRRGPGGGKPANLPFVIATTLARPHMSALAVLRFR
jgi:hypothetical protein